MSRRQKLFEAGAMQQVAAIWYVARNSGRVNVLEAHWAIRSGDVFHALRHGMQKYIDIIDGDWQLKEERERIAHPVSIGFQLHRQTHVTDFAVKESVLPADPTNSASFAVVLVLVLVIEQVAHEAGVLEETNKQTQRYSKYCPVHCNCITLSKP